MVAPSTQCTADISENYFWKCEKFFLIWNLTLGLQFPSNYLWVFFPPHTAIMGKLSLGRLPPGKLVISFLPALPGGYPYRACCQSQAWIPHLIAHCPLISRAAVWADCLLHKDGVNWWDGSLHISYLWQYFHDTADFVIIHIFLLKISFCSMFFLWSIKTVICICIT